MALLGVLGDIHGNREALDAALAALRQRQVERLLCLGDIVGYNADPDECVDALRARRALAIAGNHDLIALRRLGFARCSNKTMYALKRTRETLGDEAATWLDALPANRIADEGVVMVHGGVRDVQQYMLTPAHVAENAAYLRADFPGARLCFFSHSLEPCIYAVKGNDVREVRRDESVYLVKDIVYFINPGSVDASRKRGEKLAEFAVLDTGEWRLDLVRVPYDAGATEAKASTFGYRIDLWTDRFYDFRRKISQIRTLRFL